MPHKHNPAGCSVTLAAAHRVPGLIAAFLSAMVQEHERGVGGWQAEWPVTAAIIQATGLAAASMAEVARGITIDGARMRANIDATRGAVFAERAMMLLAPSLGRDTAYRILEEASRRSLAQSRRLVEVLCEMPEVTSRIDRAALSAIDVPEQYLGMAEYFRERLLSVPEPNDPPHKKE